MIKNFLGLDIWFCFLTKKKIIVAQEVQNGRTCFRSGSLIKQQTANWTLCVYLIWNQFDRKKHFSLPIKKIVPRQW